MFTSLRTKSHGSSEPAMVRLSFASLFRSVYGQTSLIVQST
jgi:hypothetical protein